MKITWKKCVSYEKACESYKKAEDNSGAIYLHEWSGQPFYWGKVGCNSSLPVKK